MFWSRAIIFFSTLKIVWTPKEAKETVETVEFGVAIYVNIKWYGGTEETKENRKTVETNEIHADTVWSLNLQLLIVQHQKTPLKLLHIRCTL